MQKCRETLSKQPDSFKSHNRQERTKNKMKQHKECEDNRLKMQQQQNKEKERDITKRVSEIETKHVRKKMQNKTKAR